MIIERVKKIFANIKFARALKNNRYCHITISDYGIGIAEVLSVCLKKAIAEVHWVTFTPCYSCQKTEGIYQNTDLVYFEYLEAVKPVRLTVSEARIIRNENQIGGIKNV